MNILISHIMIFISSIVIILFAGSKMESLFDSLLQFLYDRMTNRGLKYGIKYDKEGYPLYNYGRRNNEFIGYQYNPIVMCWLADRIYRHDKTTQDNRKIIMKYADMAAKRHIEDGVFTAVLKFCWPPYHIKEQWSSGLVYGRLIQLFVRAFDISNEKRFLDYAETVLINFRKDINEGGVRIQLSDDEWWYEEYASAEISSPMVLNGMISTVLCINELHEKRSNAAARELIDKGVRAIENNIEKFDRDGYSYYDLQHHICSPYYHNFHIELLGRLIEKFPKNIFEKMLIKWSLGNQKNFLIKSLRHPTKRSVSVLALSFISLIVLMEMVYLVASLIFL